MIAPLRPGAALAQINGPVIETERLILRQWRGSDIAPNTAMLSDPDTARFITADRKPVTDALNGWRNCGDHGRALGAVRGRHVRGRGEIIGTFYGPGRPMVSAVMAGLRSGVGYRERVSRQGYAVEASRAAIDWAFVNFEIRAGRPYHRPHEYGIASRGRRLGADKRGQAEVFGHVVDVWVTGRGAKQAALEIEAADDLHYDANRTFAVTGAA